MFDTPQRFLIRLASIGFLGALLVTASPGDTNAQVTCGWCQSGPLIVVDDNGDVSWYEGHRFLFEGGGECLWEGHDEPAIICARCGGTSFCHADPMEPTHCNHILCGPARDAMAAAAEIREALETQDISVVASSLTRERAGVSVEFSPESGRIEVMLPCDLNRAAATIPVSPRLRVALAAETGLLQR